MNSVQAHSSYCMMSRQGKAVPWAHYSRWEEQDWVDTESRVQADQEAGLPRIWWQSQAK